MLWQFHNGTMTSSGAPFIKLSATHEYSINGVQSRSDIYQNIPLSIFSNIISDIKKGGYVRVDRTTGYSTITSVHELCEVGCGYHFRVNDYYGNIVGILSITFIKENVVLTNVQIQEMKEYSNKITILLSKVQLLTGQRNRRKTDKGVSR